MRPSSPTPQCLQQVCHPSTFLPRAQRIRGTIQERLSFQIDGFLTGFRSYRVMLNTNEPNCFIGPLNGLPKRHS